MERRTFLQTAGIGSTGFLLPVSAQSPDGGGNPGEAPEGQAAFEFLGRSDQNGPTVLHYGYLTHVFGLPDEVLFVDPTARTEATARLTFVSTTTLDSRHTHGNIITTSGLGELIVYLASNPGASFNDPGSFALGAPIATYAVRYHNVLNVQTPNQGVVTASVEMEQRTAQVVGTGDVRRRFGRPGLRARLTASGQGTRTQPDPVQAFFLVGGSAVVTGA
jgi:hypothetical protein